VTHPVAALRAIGGVALAAVLASAASGVETLGPVSWRRVELGASKLLLSATTSLSVQRLPAERAGALLRRVPEGTPVPVPGPEVIALTTDTALPFGRHEVTTVLLDPASGAVLQGDKLVTGRKPYQKVFRYTREGFFFWRAAPASPGEEESSPEGWSKRRARLVRAVAPLPAGAVVTDSYALLYLVSAAGLNRQGSAFTAFILADDQPVELRFEAGGLVQQDADYQERRAGDSRRRRGPVLLRTVVVKARALSGQPGGGDVDLGFLGMRGGVRILVEAGTGLPVQVVGRTDAVGELTVNLQAVEWGVPVLAGHPAR
jgi:hypothetical protein